MPKCPQCNCQHIVKNGHIHNGKQRFLCRQCGMQFVENPTNKRISQETKDLIDRLLLEKISLRGIARACQVSLVWLQNYVNQKYETVPKKIEDLFDTEEKNKKKRRLIIECDEIWSFVQNKENKQWGWFAIDPHTSQIVGVFVGDRSAVSAKGLWNSLPDSYKNCAICYTDFWEAYHSIFPPDRHFSVEKKSGLTSHIEGFNSKLRQRVSRLVRKTLSFSKKLENHIGAIWFFVHYHNQSLHF